MSLNTDELKIKITDKIFNSYTRQGFGRLLKAEIDLIMFDFSLKLIFLETKPDYFENDELNYFLINKQDIYELSKRLKVTEAKIIGFIEQVGLLKGLLNDEIALKYFWSLLKSQKQNEETLKNGNLHCYVPNKLIKSFIEAKIDFIGRIPDYSENKEILIFSIATVAELFNIDSNEFAKWIEQINKTINDKSLASIQSKLIAKDINLNQIGVNMLKTIGSKFVGQSSDMIVDSFFNMIKEYNTNDSK